MKLHKPKQQKNEKDLNVYTWHREQFQPFFTIYTSRELSLTNLKFHKLGLSLSMYDNKVTLQAVKSCQLKYFFLVQMVIG